MISIFLKEMLIIKLILKEQAKRFGVRKEWKLLLVKATFVKIQNIDKSLQMHAPGLPCRSFLALGLAGNAGVNHDYPMAENLEVQKFQNTETIRNLNYLLI